MPEPTAEARETAAVLAVELLALDIKARQAGTSVVDLLANLARSSLGLDIRPTAEDIETVAPTEPADPAPEPAGNA